MVFLVTKFKLRIKLQIRWGLNTNRISYTGSFNGLLNLHRPGTSSWSAVSVQTMDMNINMASVGNMVHEPQHDHATAQIYNMKLEMKFFR